MARIASFLVGGMKWLEEKALALLPFPLAAAKNTGAPVFGYQPAKKYIQRAATYFWMLKISSGKTGLN